MIEQAIFENLGKMTQMQIHRYIHRVFRKKLKLYLCKIHHDAKFVIYMDTLVKPALSRNTGKYEYPVTGTPLKIKVSCKSQVYLATQ